MSRVEFRNLHRRLAVHRPSGRAGDLRLHDRVVTRGRGASLAVVTTFDAIFTFDDPLTCPLSDVPEHGGYFMQEDGTAEVTQLIASFDSVEERAALLKSDFDTGPE